jgi:hypothetical protein
LKVPYVVTEPESSRRVYDTWGECQGMLAGSVGPRRCTKVESREEGSAILSGGVILDPGLHAFTDGNARGDVGVVVVLMSDNENSEPQVVQEIATSVGPVFEDVAIPGLQSGESIEEALGDAPLFWRRWRVCTPLLPPCPNGSR